MCVPGAGRCVRAAGRRPDLTLASCLSSAEPGPGRTRPPPPRDPPARRPAFCPPPLGRLPSPAAAPPPPGRRRGPAPFPVPRRPHPTPPQPRPKPRPLPPPGPHPCPLQRLLLPRCIVGARSVVHLPFDLRQGLPHVSFYAHIGVHQILCRHLHNELMLG